MVIFNPASFQPIDLFEEGAAEGKHVLLRNAITYTENWREDLNRDILEKLGKDKA